MAITHEIASGIDLLPQSGSVPMHTAEATFRKAYPTFEKTSLLDELRKTEYARLDDQQQVYLDYTGGGQYAESQLREHMELLRSHVFGNPHSTNPASQAMTNLVEHVRTYVLDYFNSGFSIIEQGEQANSLYLILSGTADVIREAADGTLQFRARLEPGDFFGEEGLAHKKPRNAHVVAVENVTCLVFSPSTPTTYLGRGEDAHLTQFARANGQDEADMMGATTRIDVGPYVQQKIAAIAAHRSQYALEADILPLTILQELMGREYFVRVHPAPKIETELLPSLSAAPELQHA